MSRAASGVLSPVGFPNVAVVPQNVVGVSGAGGLSTSAPFHITTNATNTILPPGTATAIRVKQIVLNISGTPSAWVVKIQTKAATPMVLYTNTFNAATTVTIQVGFGDGVVAQGGVDIITSGTTPGIADLWVSY
jgi:hypothetical protein